MRTLYFIAGFIIGAFIFTCNAFNPTLQGSSEQVDTLSWINNAGDIVTSLKGDPEAFAAFKIDIIDSLAKVYNSKPTSIIEYVIAETATDAELKPDGPQAADYFPIDSLIEWECPPVPKNLRQNFSSPYYRAQVQIGDSSYMKLQSFDTVTVLWKRIQQGNFFNRRSIIQLDVSTANPDTKVSGLKAYRIHEKPKAWAIGLQLGYGLHYNGKTVQPGLYGGVGITKTLIRF